MTRKIIIAAVMLFLLAPAQLSAHPAIEVVDLIWKFAGGKDNYRSARYLEFTWASDAASGERRSERHHLWDRYEGRYVLKLKDPKNGDDLAVYFSIESKEGTVQRNGEIIEGEEAQQLIERSYRVFINDTYWLLAPLKLRDPGVRLRYVRHDGEEEQQEEEDDGHGHEGHDHRAKTGVDERDIVLHAWFENVGVTPGDQYWFFVTHDGRITRWQYKLQGGGEGEWAWSDEKDCGMGVVLSTVKTNAEGARIHFPTVRFSADMDEARFNPGG